MTAEQKARLEEEMVSRPVRALQHMLRRLSLRYEAIPELQPDGRFGERTLEGVMRYQKEKALPVTGVVDQNTWQILRDEWLELERELEEPRALRAFPRGASTSEGEREEHLYVVQAMFQALENVLEGIAEEEIDGLHSGTSVENTRWLQGKAGLKQTGEMDRDTWDALSRLYELFVVRKGRTRPQIDQRRGQG